MLVIRNVLTGKSITQTPYYKGLVTTTTAQAGFETLVAQVEASTVAINAREQWLGHEIQYLGIDGVLWEGVIEQVQAAEGYYNIFAVGNTLWELAATGIYGVYYDNNIKSWTPLAETVANRSTIRATVGDTAIDFGIAQGQLIDSVRNGVEYLSPYAGATYGNIKWFSLQYQRLAELVVDDGNTPPGVGGGFDFSVYGYNTSGESLLLNVGLGPTVDPAPITFTWAAPDDAHEGWQAIRIVIYKTLFPGQVSKGESVESYVRVTSPEVSLLRYRPKAGLIIQHIIDRIDKTFTRGNRYVSSAHILTPIIADGTQPAGQQAIVATMNNVVTDTGVPWFYGAYAGYQFSMDYQPRLNHWSITSRDQGEASMFQAERGAPVLGGTDIGVVTHVRPHYKQTDGLGKFGTTQPTGLYLPRSRTETIESTSGAASLPDAEARAIVHKTQSQNGTFVVKDAVKMYRGGSRSPAVVRAGDWVSVETLGLGQVINEFDLKRGGIIGKTTYNGDSNEVTLELLGAD